MPAYHHGTRSVQEQRISGIEAYVNWQQPNNRGTLARRYAFVYETLDGRATNTSRLRRIQELDASGNGLQPLEFAWTSDKVFGSAVLHSANSPAIPPPERYVPETCGRTTGVICP